MDRLLKNFSQVSRPCLPCLHYMHTSISLSSMNLSQELVANELFVVEAMAYGYQYSGCYGQIEYTCLLLEVPGSLLSE